MKILTVIPIAKGIPQSELSYFSAREVHLGTLVTVPFGNRSIKGVVVDINEVRDLKSSIKTSDFKLRNVTTIHTGSELPNSVFNAAQKSASFFAQPIGAVLETVLPKQVFDYYVSKVSDKQDDKRGGAGGRPPAINPPHIQALQVPASDRISWYKTIIRECLAKNESIMIIAPSIASAEHWFKTLQTGIEDRIVLAHSKKTKKQVTDILDKVVEGNHPVVLVATAPFATLLRNDWNTIIIEQSASPYYRYEFGPVIDLRFFVEILAHRYGSRLIYADTLLPVNVRVRITNHEIIDARSTWHIAQPRTFEIVDMKKSTIPGMTSTPFALLHPNTIAMIREGLGKKQPILLMTNRKGLAPMTICGECGHIVSCPICDTPLVLHRKKSSGNGSSQKPHNTTQEAGPTRIYLCHHCMHMTLPEDRCMKCGTWNLKMMGIGSDTVFQEVQEKFPQASVFIIDADTHTTPSSISKTITTWQQSAGGILVATSMALPYIESSPYGCIISIDSLLSLPSYTSGERALQTSLGFLEKITEQGIIQTRTIEHEVIKAIQTENIFDFIRNEIEMRTQFNYPPACVLIKISCDLNKDLAGEAVKYLETCLKPYDPDIVMKKSKQPNRLIVQAILRTSEILWNDPDGNLRAIVQTLGNDWKKEVNPETVL